MSEEMSEEEFYMKRVNDLREALNTREFFEYIGDGDYYSVGVTGLLDLYQKKKEKIEAMNKGIDELTREKQDLKTELYMNSVSKDKIREKIAELEKQTQKIINTTYIPINSKIFDKNKEKYEPMLEARNILISVLNGLKELLED